MLNKHLLRTINKTIPNGSRRHVFPSLIRCTPAAAVSKRQMMAVSHTSPIPIPNQSSSSSSPSFALGAASSLQVSTAKSTSRVPKVPIIEFNGRDVGNDGEVKRELSDLAERRRQEGEVDNEKEENEEKVGGNVIVIGISGASSSGKTTLAIILAEIFTLPDMLPALSLGNSSSTYATSTNQKEQNRNILIHQDLFFYNKGAAEHTTFSSLPADSSFCHATLQRGDEVGEYVLSEDRRGSFNVSGPDTDHLSAINMWGLLKAIVFAKGKGRLPDIGVLEGKGEYGMPLNIRVTQEQIDSIKGKYADIIAIGRKKVAEWSRQIAIRNLQFGFKGHIVGKSPFPVINPRFLFVEGFLLYHRPDTASTIRDADPENEGANRDNKLTKLHYTQKERQKREDAMAWKLLDHLAKKLQRGEEYTNGEMEYVQEHHYLALLRAFKQIMPLIDIKLFLPTSMKVAKDRRMKRLEYIDEPVGTRRLGQMWKTEGYFEHVAWKNHILQHGWLVDWKGSPLSGVGDGDIEGEVLMRQVVNAGVEETVEWAVGRILEKLAGMEDNARVAEC